MSIIKSLTSLVLLAGTSITLAAEQPNIVILFCDDLGYGDVQILNPERGKIPTPHLDQMARDGMIFTDAHTGSSVCTPTRYGLLTGRYSWRTHLQQGVVQGYADNLIAADRPTIASTLQQAGYHTAIIGKWHLNFQYQAPKSGETLKPANGATPPVGAIIPDGPTTRGFDYFHGFHHARSMEAVIDQNEVIAHDPTINMLPRITEKSIAYITERAQQKDTPFFLYVPYGSPHTPIVPTPEWQGKSGISPYADFVMQNDHSVGQILQSLEDHGLTDNTLVFFFSDNGCSKAANFKTLEAAGHYASAQYRGSKADLWDGGHRVPFIVKWPGKIQKGSTSSQLICATDLFATLCEVTNTSQPEKSAEDSISFLPAFSHNEIPTTRQGIIHHSISGHFAYRSGKWKLLLAPASAGWTKDKGVNVKELPGVQLYDMEQDPSETTNLQAQHPEVVKDLLAKLNNDVYSGRSTKGPASPNDYQKIKLWKSKKPAHLPE